MNRVLVLNHFAAPLGAPGGTRHVELFGRLEGWEAIIVASNRNYITQEPQRRQAGFLPVWSSPYSSNGPTRILNWITYAFCAFLRCLLLRRPAIVYASSPHLLAALAGLMLSRVWRVPLVLEIRDLWPQVLVDMGQMDPASTLFRLLTRLEVRLYRAATAIVYLAPGVRERLVGLGCDDHRLFYIPNAADPEDFVVTCSRDGTRNHFGFDGFTAVYAGAHGPANGLDLLLRAAETLRSEDVSIVLVGSGVTKPSLQRRAQEKQLSNVRFMEPLPKSAIPALLSAADAGLHVLADVGLFRSSVSPNKLFDYMAAGLPVLTNVPGYCGDLVREADCGVAVEPSDLACGLLQLCHAQTPARRALGAHGREWITEHQSRSAMSSRLHSLLEQVRLG